MQQDILINCSPQETRAAVVEFGVVQELHVERSLERGLVGNVYLGKVIRVLPGLQSAFIDIGLERSAFLHVADLISSVHARHADAQDSVAAAIPIEKQVFEGQSLMLQVLKEPMGTKGARLTGHLSVAGRLLVYFPQDQHIGVSQKIPQDQRDSLRKRLQDLVGQDGGGFILRTNAEDASDQELAEDIAYLRKTWARIKHASQHKPAGSLLHQDLGLIQRVLRDVVTEQTQTIRLDSLPQFETLKAFAEEFMPQMLPKLKLYNSERPIFDLFNIDQDVSKALERRVELKSGGYLIVDQTEALTTIDVNTGAYVGAKNFDDTIFKTNLEACGAIARQLRLRNLGGIVIVDFIDMAQSRHQEAVLAELSKQLTRDRIRTTMSGFSSLGLVEMTRKRNRESLARLLCEPCAVCSGKGIVKTTRSVAYDILREILREARQFNPKEIRVIASPQVIELFLDEESLHLTALMDTIGKPVALQADVAMAQEQYDVLLL